MVFGYFFSSSSPPTNETTDAPDTASPSSSHSSTSSKVDSLLPPIAAMDLNLLTPSSASFTELSSARSEKPSRVPSPASGKPVLSSSSTVDAPSFPRSPSYQSIFSIENPPPVKTPYKRSEALDDLPAISFALEMFLNSKMLESEQFCDENDKAKERLYFTTGYGLIQCVKGLMSYEDEDLLSGITHVKHGNQVADLHRKKQAFLGSRLAGYVVSSLHPTGISFIQSMTPVERHAELMYAETLFEKALLGIVYSGDWLAFIKEALNMRTTISIYRQLGAYLDAVDAEAVEAGNGPIDTTIDAHFRSGVYLGVGMCNITLSMMPGRLATLIELFGYKGDRKLGLELLMKAGGWVEGEDEPKVTSADEGLRRSLCDMTLLLFHLVLSSFTFDGVNIDIADKILRWNLKRYPNGVFFLFGAGRLYLCRSQPRLAIEYYTKAMESQQQYRNLHHISFWEIAIANLALWDIPESLKCWTTLEAEATWSKAIYSYGLAVCMLELSGDDKSKKEEAAKLMDKVPNLRQKIAGKSIPLEKFVARKARKFQMQARRLSLPALELAYIFLGIAHAPRTVIAEKMVPEIDRLLLKLNKLHGKSEKEIAKGYEGGKGGYWDDYCLAMFLMGVCMRYLAYPESDALVSSDETASISKEEAEKRAKESFTAVFEHGPKIELDHHLVYHAHYELGRLLACQGDVTGAANEFELVLSGKYLEVGPSGKKGKYSMENALHVRTHAALEALDKKRL